MNYQELKTKYNELLGRLSGITPIITVEPPFEYSQMDLTNMLKGRNDMIRIVPYLEGSEIKIGLIVYEKNGDNDPGDGSGGGNGPVVSKPSGT